MQSTTISPTLPSSVCAPTSFSGPHRDRSSPPFRTLQWHLLLARPEQPRTAKATSRPGWQLTVDDAGVVLLQPQDIALLVGEDELLLLAEVGVVIQSREDGTAVGVQAVRFIVADRDDATAQPVREDAKVFVRPMNRDKPERAQRRLRVVVVHADGKCDRIVCARGYH